jgi:hypothetical protein
MPYRLVALRLLVIGLFAAVPSTANAALISFTIDNSPLTLSPGDTGVALLGTITNTGGFDVYLNGITTAPPTGIVVDDTPFFLLSSPLGPFASTGSTTIVTLAANPSILPGDYSGGIFILGGTSPFEFGVLASADFRVTIADAVPEPATLTLFAVGLAGAAARLRRWRRN